MTSSEITQSKIISHHKTQNAWPASSERVIIAYSDKTLHQLENVCNYTEQNNKQQYIIPMYDRHGNHPYLKKNVPIWNWKKYWYSNYDKGKDNL